MTYFLLSLILFCLNKVGGSRIYALDLDVDQAEQYRYLYTDTKEYCSDTILLLLFISRKSTEQYNVVNHHYSLASQLSC